ncbi:MAG: hypothetical protein H0V86_12205 [Chloroflexia bacterium]|nr:hypothetical protein [Chloroflexia bacterium]
MEETEQPCTRAAIAAVSTTRPHKAAALQEGGTYYLPYRLHASPEQFARAYPQGREFFARKRAYDPDELFQNEFYRTYGRP